MPKLARQYDREKYSNYSSYYANNRHDYQYGSTVLQYPNKNDDLRVSRRVRPKRSKKKKTLPLLFSLAVICSLLSLFMPYSYTKVTKQLLSPTPYKNIKINMEEFAFPTRNYLSNSLYLDKRMMSFSADKKHSKMVQIPENVNMPLLQQKLQDLMALYPNVKPAVFVWDYETQNYVDINASKHYSTASIIKIPVLIDVFKSIEAGQFTLDDTMQITDYYRTEGSGSLQFKGEAIYSIDELARVMITESDNSATNMLMAKVGSMEDVNQSMRDWGLKNTQVKAWLPDMRGDNYTTARDMAKMLYNIDENTKFLAETSRLRILDYMSHVHNNRLIQAGLGPNAVFFHKTGDIGTMLGDAGIVVAPNGKKYIVVILAKRPHNAIAGKEFIVKASEIIYNYMVR